MSQSDLERVANALVAKAKGILAADESTSTITKQTSYAVHTLCSIFLTTSGEQSASSGSCIS